MPSEAESETFSSYAQRVELFERRSERLPELKKTVAALLELPATIEPHLNALSHFNSVESWLRRWLREELSKPVTVETSQQIGRYLESVAQRVHDVLASEDELRVSAPSKLSHVANELCTSNLLSRSDCDCISAQLTEVRDTQNRARDTLHTCGQLSKTLAGELGTIGPVWPSLVRELHVQGSSIVGQMSASNLSNGVSLLRELVTTSVGISQSVQEISSLDAEEAAIRDRLDIPSFVSVHDQLREIPVDLTTVLTELANVVRERADRVKTLKRLATQSDRTLQSLEAIRSVKSPWTASLIRNFERRLDAIAIPQEPSDFSRVLSALDTIETECECAHRAVVQLRSTHQGLAGTSVQAFPRLLDELRPSRIISNHRIESSDDPAGLLDSINTRLNSVVKRARELNELTEILWEDSAGSPFQDEAQSLCRQIETRTGVKNLSKTIQTAKNMLQEIRAEERARALREREQARQMRIAGIAVAAVIGVLIVGWLIFAVVIPFLVNWWWAILIALIAIGWIGAKMK